MSDFLFSFTLTNKTLSGQPGFESLRMVTGRLRYRLHDLDNLQGPSFEHILFISVNFVLFVMVLCKLVRYIYIFEMLLFHLHTES